MTNFKLFPKENKAAVFNWMTFFCLAHPYMEHYITLTVTIFLT